MNVGFESRMIRSLSGAERFSIVLKLLRCHRPLHRNYRLLVNIPWHGFSHIWRSQTTTRILRTHRRARLQQLWKTVHLWVVYLQFASRNIICSARTQEIMLHITQSSTETIWSYLVHPPLPNNNAGLVGISHTPAASPTKSQIKQMSFRI